MIGKIQRALATIQEKRHKPLHIEFNLTDFCNLNCKGCSHYSPLAPAEFEPLGELEHSMKRISEIKDSDKIEEVYLIGGETLLYPQLPEAIKLARKYFPLAKISIFTNGILIPKMNDEFWETCRSENCVISITRYPVKFDYDAVAALCKEKGVECEVFGDRGEDNSFFKLPLDPQKKQNGRIAHFKCISFGCITVDHGKIFPCPQSACVGHLNKKFGTEFKWENGDYINVDEIRDVKELYDLRNKPVPFCKYCCQVKPVAYGPSKREVSEWL